MRPQAPLGVLPWLLGSLLAAGCSAPPEPRDLTNAFLIADVVYLDPAEDNWRDTKPPLAGWAIETIFESTADV